MKDEKNLLLDEIYKKQQENAKAKVAGLKEPHSAKSIEVMWQSHKGTTLSQSPNCSSEIRFASSFAKTDFKRLTENEATKWTGTHWQTVAPFELKSLAYEWLKKNAEGEAKKSKADSCATCVLYELEKIETAVSNHIPFTNAYLEIHEAEIDFGFKYRAPDRLSNLQYCIPTELNMSAADAVYYVPEPVPQTSLFAKFLSVSLPDLGTQQILQEFIGSTLLADTRYQTAAFFIGEGRNGKGVMMRLAKALHRQTAAMLLNKLQDFGLQGLVGASLALVDEAPKSGVNEQVLKSLIAGESVMVDRKHMTPLTFAPTAKWIISANHIPKFTDHSEGFWRRWIVIPFDVQIDQKEVQSNLAERIIKEELHIVANWALAGLQRLLSRGRFQTSEEMPQAVLKAIGRAKSESDAVKGWIDDQEVKTTTKAIEWTEKNALYAEFKDWCEDQGKHPVAQAEFYKRLQRILNGVEERREQRGGKRERLVNITLQNEKIEVPEF